MQVWPRVDILILLQNIVHNAHTSQPTHPSLWTVGKALAHELPVPVVCMLTASSLSNAHEVRKGQGWHLLILPSFTAKAHCIL